MGNTKSTRWNNHAKKRTIESCRRITPREAAHVGISTVADAVAGTSAQRQWYLCECGARVKFLYQLAEEGEWKCKTCHNLTYRKSQVRGTNEAFERFFQRLTCLKPDWNREFFPDLANAAMEEIHALWQKDVAPYDWDRVDAKRRAELLQFYKNEAAVRQAFEHQRWLWSGKMNEIDQSYGRKIMQQLRERWNTRHRSANKKASDRHADNEI